MNLHLAMNVPMTKSAVLALCKLVELLKAIEHTFHRRSMFIAESLTHIIQYLSYLALATLETAKVGPNWTYIQGRIFIYLKGGFPVGYKWPGL
jgi:hypothetical protein